MSELLQRIETYWGKRADSFAVDTFREDKTDKWRKVLLQELPGDRSCNILDIGTGPGFFAVMLAKEGYQVTAVDYTPEMLEKAKENADKAHVSVTFARMDAQNLELPDAHFDAIVTRNLTWNLENPQKAYQEWHRVLKPGGILLNFDAPWYEYLYDADKQEAYEQDRKNTLEARLVDSSISYPEAAVMEDISRELIFSKLHRPAADMELVINAGFEKIAVHRGIWKDVWSEEEQLIYASTPMFMIRAEK